MKGRVLIGHLIKFTEIVEHVVKACWAKIGSLSMQQAPGKNGFWTWLRREPLLKVYWVAQSTISGYKTKGNFCINLILCQNSDPKLFFSETG